MDVGVREEILAKIARLEADIDACKSQLQRLESETQASRAHMHRLQRDLEAYRKLLEPDPHPSFEVIPYHPHGSPAPDAPKVAKPRWKGAFDQLAHAAAREARDLTFMIKSLPIYKTRGQREVIEMARLLGKDAAADGDKATRNFKELVLTSLCVLLQQLGYYKVDEINDVLRTICIGDPQAKYLDTLKRGARFANELAASWAGTSHDLDRLGRASQVVLDAGLSMSQWSTLHTYGREVRPALLSRALPPSRSPCIPLFIPSLIELLVDGRIQLETIRLGLGYGPVDKFVTAQLNEVYKPFFPVHVEATAVEWIFERPYDNMFSLKSMLE